MISPSSSPSPAGSPPPQSHSASPSPSSKRKTPCKKSPPLPWTHQETLALIHAYQEKWYSLKKGQLKAIQWEEVAITVAARCGYDEPSKTATQCRHKIEKLRKRYRSEVQKPYPNTWQYFEPMYQMERGPMPLTALPITVAKCNPNKASSNSSLHSSSTDYYNNDGGAGGSGGGSDDSDERWNIRRGAAAAAARNKSKSINSIVRGDVRSGKRAALEGESGGRRGRAVRNPMNEKERQYSNGDDSDDGAGEGELAAEIRGFTERFVWMERKRIEAMQETERYRMEMEKKKLEMIVEAQRRMVDTIGRAFGYHKSPKLAQDS